MTQGIAKILIVLASPIPSAGAAWSRVGFMANFLHKRGNLVVLGGAFSLKSINKAGSTTWEGIRVLNWMPMISSLNSISIVLNFFSSIIFSFFLFLSERPNIVIISVPGSGNPLGCFLVSRLFRCITVADYRDEWEDYIIQRSSSTISRIISSLLKRSMTNCYLNSNLVVTVTEKVANSLRREGVKNVKIIPNGADITIFYPRDKTLTRKKIGVSPSDIVLVYSGYIGTYYRLDIVIRAIQNLADRGKLKLLIVGYGKSVAQILDLIKKNKMENHIIHLGTKNDKFELAEILSASDIGIVPYDGNPLWKNSIPVKCLEYFACGLPVIATVHDDSILANIIRKNEIGLVSKPEDVDDLAQAIECLVSDMEFRLDSSKRAFSFAQANYDRNKIAIEFESLLHGFLVETK
jgi:glycosyltransferase involved in cell wall biosynthesis